MLSEVFRIPEIYTEMSRKGFFNKDTFLWLNDMEWIPIEKIGDYEYEDGESRSVVPFAFTGGGDKWVWVIDEGENDYPVGLCEGAEVNGIYYARNTRDAILRQIIEFVSGSNFYVNAEEAKSYQFSEAELKELLKKWKNSFEGILSDEQLELISRFSTMPLKHIESKYGEWYALLSDEESGEMIRKYLGFDRLDDEFEWFIS